MICFENPANVAENLSSSPWLGVKFLVNRSQDHRSTDPMNQERLQAVQGFFFGIRREFGDQSSRKLFGTTAQRFLASRNADSFAGFNIKPAKSFNRCASNSIASDPGYPEGFGASRPARRNNGPYS